MYGGHIGTHQRSFGLYTIGTKAHKIFGKSSRGRIVMESRKFSGQPCFLRLLYLSKVHIWDWNYYAWVCSPQWVSPKQLTVTLNDLEWPFCVTVLAFCRQNCHRHKCTEETLVTGRGDIMFYGIIVHLFNHFRLSKLSTANCGIQITEYSCLSGWLSVCL